MNALKPVPFKEANRELYPAMYSKQHKGIVVFTDGEQCISRWKLTLRQRLSVLIFGRMWLGIRSGNSMPGAWLDCGMTCFIKEKKQKKGNKPMLKKVLVIIAIILTLAAAGYAAYMFTNPPPMTGHISGKTYHPAYFPALDDTPWVRVLTITSADGTRSCTWVVDEDTYNSYSVGDNVKRGVHGNDNDTAAAPGQGAS